MNVADNTDYAAHGLSSCRSAQLDSFASGSIVRGGRSGERPFPDECHWSFPAASIGNERPCSSDSHGVKVARLAI